MECETKCQETYEEHQHLEDIMKMILKECEDKMYIKVEVLSKKVQDWWRFSKTDGEVCHEKLRSQHPFRRYDEDDFKS